MKSLLFVSFVQVLGYILLLVGLCLSYWLNRRRFNRTVGYRTEGFRSYEHKTATRTLEWLFKKIAWAFILFGGFLVAIEYFNHRDIIERPEQKEISRPANP